MDEYRGKLDEGLVSFSCDVRFCRMDAIHYYLVVQTACTRTLA